jgi:protein required for attachment to host cells
MSRLRIPHGAWVLVGDGRKALFLRNEGDADFPNLKVEQVLKQDNPATSAQGTDQPGRSFSSVGHGRSAYEGTDWHELQEHRFARDIVRALSALTAAARIKALIVVAPPKTLADLRSEMPNDVEALVVAEIDKDLTKHPVHEIEKVLTGG